MVLLVVLPSSVYPYFEEGYHQVLGSVTKFLTQIFFLPSAARFSRRVPLRGVPLVKPCDSMLNIRSRHGFSFHNTVFESFASNLDIDFVF